MSTALGASTVAFRSVRQNHWRASRPHGGYRRLGHYYRASVGYDLREPISSNLCGDGVSLDRQRQNARSSVGEGVRRRTAKTLRPTHMRPPMAVPASAENEEPPWPDLRNMEGQEGFYPYRMSEDLIGSYNR